MGFDRNRPVPWRRLLKLFVIYAIVINVALALIDRKHYGLGVVYASITGGLFYLGFAALLAKFGWQPRTLSENRALRAQRMQARTDAKAGNAKGGRDAAGTSGATRNRPAPTRRTAYGVGRQRPSAKR